VQDDHQHQRGGHDDDQERDLPARSGRGWPRPTAVPVSSLVSGCGLVSHVGFLFCRTGLPDLDDGRVLSIQNVLVKS